ncbi:MAG: DUF2341 domain-containing protein [Candidatus Nanoarchaeia archaeon]
MIKLTELNFATIYRLTGFIFLVFIIFNLSAPASFSSFSPPWEDFSQPYRVEFNLTGATSTYTDYTMIMDINSTFMGPNYNFSIHRDTIRMYYYNRSTNTSIPIPHYFNQYNAGSQTGEIQFKVPNMSNSQDSEIVLYFGDDTKSNSEDYCGTFIHCDFFNSSTIDSIYELGDFDLVSGTDFSIVSNTLSITAGGDDTWTGDDEYGSVYLEDIEGDVDIQVAVIDHGNVNPWNKAGIMMRNDLDEPTVSTGYVYQVITSGNGYVFQHDSDDNGYLDTSTPVSSRVLPSYLRLTKLGQTFEGFYSTTTPNSWTSVNSITKTSANSTQDIGLSLTSHAGATLETVRYDNYTIKRFTTDTISPTNSTSNTLPNELRITIETPSTISITSVEVNTTTQISANISCFSYNGVDSCGTINISTQYLGSDLSTTSLTPLWSTSSNPQTCLLNANEWCVRNFSINVTGTVGTIYNTTIFTQSSESEIEDSTSHNIQLRPVEGTVIEFNQSVLDLGTTTQFNGSLRENISIRSRFGGNSNIEINCVSGDCSTITPSVSLILNLMQDSSANVEFTCDDQISGSYSAQFQISSDESSVNDFIDVSCIVEKIFGPISITQLQPSSSGITLLQNESVTLRYNLSCAGECGEVQSSLVSSKANWWNLSWENRQSITINNTILTPANYQVLVQLNTSNFNNYSWTNSCEDLRFIKNNSQELSYWIEECNTTSEFVDVWVKIDDSISTGEIYNLSVYYNNNIATTNSNASSTFRSDEIHIVNGLWDDSAPVSSDHINDNSDANNLKSIIGENGWSIQGSGYVDEINQGSNLYGADDYYFSRYRFLFIPSTTTTHTFRTNSDDGSEIGIWGLDGYGSGLKTPVSIVLILKRD